MYHLCDCFAPKERLEHDLQHIRFNSALEDPAFLRVQLEDKSIMPCLTFKKLNQEMSEPVFVLCNCIL